MPDDAEFMRTLFKEFREGGPDARGAMAGIVAALRNKYYAAIADPPRGDEAALVERLKSDGVIELGRLIDDARIAGIHAYLAGKPVYNAHNHTDSDGVPVTRDDLSRSAQYGCYEPNIIQDCPDLLELANDPRLLRIAEGYLGCPPTIYSLNIWWSFPRGNLPTPKTGQVLHRDRDDLRFLALFLYLTPVDEASGPHRYIRGSHEPARLIEALIGQGVPREAAATLTAPFFEGDGYAECYSSDSIFGRFEQVFKGPAGSAMFADTFGLHMGVPPALDSRLMAWIRYGLGPTVPPFPDVGGRPSPNIAARIPATDRANYVNRVLLFP